MIFRLKIDGIDVTPPSLSERMLVPMVFYPV
jgi:hypothetical protein